jgi:hypothetical protein
MATKVNMIETAAGVSEHPWINKPDTKYNPDGVFKNTVVFDHSLATTLNLLSLIDEKAQEVFDRLTEGLSPGEKKKWKLYVPYVLEEDDEGNPTGRVKVQFKRNHVIKLQGGETKELSVSVYDSAGKVIDGEVLPPIYGGTVLKTLFSFRDVKVPGTKQIGVKLDMAAVKILKLAKSGSAGRDPFSKDGQDEEGDGYVFEPGSAQQQRQQADEAEDEGGDF